MLRFVSVGDAIRTQLSTSVSNPNEPIMKVAFIWDAGYASRGHSNIGDINGKKEACPSQ